MDRCGAPSGTPARPPHPDVELADIVRLHGEAFRRSHVLTTDQHAVLRAIERCRTAVLGGHLDVCLACGHAHPSYNSCRNRHCPKCQGLAQARWVARRLKRVLPTHYFHVVFTLPPALRSLARRYPRQVYRLFFDAVSETLLELGRDPEWLGADLGITAVLHTWTRELTFHPHLLSRAMHYPASGEDAADSSRFQPRRHRIIRASKAWRENRGPMRSGAKPLCARVRCRSAARTLRARRASSPRLW